MHALPSMSAPTPFAEAPRAALASVRCVLTDLDDTLTEHGAVASGVVAALEKLRAAGMKTIIVTGRPAGWCDAIARLWPVFAIVGENGALAYWRDGVGALQRRFYFKERRTEALMAVAREALAAHPELKLAADQPYRVADVAVDFREDVGPFPIEMAEAVRDLFRARGFQATVSSIHVNAWAGAYTKATTAIDLLANVCKLGAPQTEALYVGDSPNDEPMFAAFPLSVGVANIAPCLPSMRTHPRWITRAARGEGFIELAERLLSARKAEQ